MVTDSAYGSGNFLTEKYISLRRIEKELLSILNQGQIVMDMDGTSQVSIGQFYGIEINDSTVTVAKTVLWNTDSVVIK